jgi:hypothetical protein
VSAAAKHVGEFAQRRQQVDNAEARHRAANEIVRQEGTERGHGLDKIIAVPERGPRNQDQKKPGFEEEGREQQTSEQSRLPFGLRFRQAVDPGCDIAIAAGLGFELDEDG